MKIFSESERITNFLASGILAVVAVFVPVQAVFAQGGEEATPIETIVVTGIRGSLKRAIDLKRNSDSIVDSIAQEDLGKFPDANVAESLQRIPGVAIDRNSGEGRFVTVRGFGPAFNTVLFNGRRVSNENPGREFSFDIIAPELITGAQIYKSSVARLQDGGIGSTINVSMARPLDLEKNFTVIGSAKYKHEDLASEYSPEFFGLVGKKSEDGRHGFLLGVSYQERESRSNHSSTLGWYRSNSITRPLNDLTADDDGNPGTMITADSRPADAIGFTAQAKEAGVFIPRNFNNGVAFEERERTGVYTALQSQLADNFLVTFDALYSKFDVETRSHDMGFYIEPGQIREIQLDENNTITKLWHNRNGAVDYISRTGSRPVESVFFGLNLDWDFSDKLNLGFDAFYSTSDAKPGDDNAFGVVGFKATGDDTNGNFREPAISHIFDITGDRKTPSITGVAFGADDLVNKGTGRLHFHQFGDSLNELQGGDNIDDSILEFRLDGTYSSHDTFASESRFGAQHSQQEKDVFRRLTPLFGPTCALCGYGNDLDDSLLTEFNAGGGYLSGSGDLFTEYLTFDPAGVADWILANLDTPGFGADGTTIGAQAPVLGGAGTNKELLTGVFNGFEATVTPGSFTVEEDIWAAYWATTFSSDQTPWIVDVGLRYTNTRTRVSGTSAPLLELRAPSPASGETTNYGTIFGPDEAVNFTKKYNHFLPSVNMTYDFGAILDGLLGRFAYSKTLTRPQLLDLTPRYVFSAAARGNLRGSQGNPELEPFVSDNYDLSLEYYFGESNYFTIGLFRKDVDDLIVKTLNTVVFDVITDITGDPTIAGGKATYGILRPNNARSAQVEGLEVGFQYTLDRGVASGLGITANATFVDSEVEQPPNITAEIFPIEGLGDSRNVILFYEKHGVSARLAWSQRDNFLEKSSAITGGEPVFVDKYSQVDFRIGYEFRNDISVFFEGTNVFEEEIAKHGRYSNHFLLLEETGARYALGVRAVF